MVFRLTTDFPHEGGAFQGAALFCRLAGRAFLSGMAMPAGLFPERERRFGRAGLGAGWRGAGSLTPWGRPGSVMGMELLYAPWRIRYILAPKPPAGDGSLFTRIAQSNDDEANLVVARDKTCFALLNRYPYNGGHLMVVPYRQVAELGDLTVEELTDLMRLTQRCVAALKRLMNPDGFNIGLNQGRAAGAGIEEHLHLHIVPRWVGDTNFMPVLADTKVLPEALTETAARLREVLQTLPA